MILLEVMMLMKILLEMMPMKRLPAFSDTSLTVCKLVVALQNNLNIIIVIIGIIMVLTIVLITITIIAIISIIIAPFIIVAIIIHCHIKLTSVLFGGIAPTVALNLQIETKISWKKIAA